MPETRPTPSHPVAGSPTRLVPGDVAPDFSLPDAQGRAIRLSDLRGSRVVLFFYPAAGTPGCTREACDFRDNAQRLLAAGYRVLGISKDPVQKLAAFAARHELPYPVLSDTSLQTLSAYGAYGLKNSYGRQVRGVIRSTVILREDGRVEHALYNVKATGHVARVVRLLGA